MKSFLLVLAGLAIGVAAVLVLSPMIMGVGAGVGILTGMKAGACLTVEAAKARGLVTPEQIDELLRSAALQIASSAQVEEALAKIDGDAECTKVVADLRAAVTDSK